MWRSKKIIILLSVAALLSLSVYLIPKLVLAAFNRLGQEGTHGLVFSARDMSLTPRLHLRTEGLKVNLKKGELPLIRGEVFESGLDYGELFRGRLLLSTEARKFSLYYSPDYTEALVRIGKRLLNLADRYNFKLQDFAFSDIKIEDSEVVMTTYPGVNKEKFFTLHDVNGEVNNIQGTEEHPLGLLRFSALVYGKTRTRLEGQFNLRSRPEEWDIDFTLRQLQLTDLNVILEKKLPMVFKKGTMDFYAEVQSKEKKLQGYVKPFLDDVKIEENEPKEELPGNFLLSILTFIYEDEEPKSVATKIPFLMKKGFKVESPGLLKTIIKHGMDQKLERGIDHELKL